MNEYHELLAEGEQLAERIERRRAAAREAADEGLSKRTPINSLESPPPIIKSRTLPELIDELERCLTMIAQTVDDQDARLSAIEATSGPSGDDPSEGDGRPFPMLSRSAFSKHDARTGVDALREMLREISVTVQGLRRRLDGLETRVTALSSNQRRGLLS